MNTKVTEIFNNRKEPLLSTAAVVVSIVVVEAVLAVVVVAEVVVLLELVDVVVSLSSLSKYELIPLKLLSYHSRLELMLFKAVENTDENVAFTSAD